jgi:hypothetical protein
MLVPSQCTVASQQSCLQSAPFPVQGEEAFRHFFQKHFKEQFCLNRWYYILCEHGPTYSIGHELLLEYPDWTLGMFSAFAVLSPATFHQSMDQVIILPYYTDHFGHDSPPSNVGCHQLIGVNYAL